MRLSQNFTLQEFTDSPKAKELGIDNIPNQIQIAAMIAWCDNIGEPIRAYFGQPVKILSGFRSNELNKALGGADDSQHTKGEAGDIEVHGVRNSVLWQFIVLSLSYDQVIAEKLKENDGTAGWVHVSHKREGKQRGEPLSFLGNGKYVNGLQFV